MKDLLLIAILIAIGLGLAARTLKAETRCRGDENPNCGECRMYGSLPSSGGDELISSIREIASRNGNQEEREEAALALVDLIDDGVLALEQGVQMVGLLLPAVQAARG